MISRDSEIQERLEEYIYELLEEVCPLLYYEHLKREARERGSRAFDHVSGELKIMSKEHEEMYVL